MAGQHMPTQTPSSKSRNLSSSESGSDKKEGSDDDEEEEEEEQEVKERRQGVGLMIPASSFEVEEPIENNDDGEESDSSSDSNDPSPVKLPRHSAPPRSTSGWRLASQIQLPQATVTAEYEDDEDDDDDGDVDQPRVPTPGRHRGAEGGAGYAVKSVSRKNTKVGEAARAALDAGEGKGKGKGKGTRSAALSAPRGTRVRT